MYGVTQGGSSVSAFVHGFEPYFYVEAPSPSFSPDDCQALVGELNVSPGRGRQLGRQLWMDGCGGGGGVKQPAGFC